ncbi:MAG: radical SAM protein [Desulfosudaceae bacterium]
MHPPPRYLAALEDGRLDTALAAARKGLCQCRLCPRACGVDRTAGETGVCRTGRSARVAGCHAHFGEEAPLVGRNGSGTIFFSHCSLLCCFCQNYEISHHGEGQTVSESELAEMMLALQQQGCHNINLVTPSHVVPQFLGAVKKAAEKGLTLPLVYNSSGYDSVETLRLLEGIVDIYMPDFKFLDETMADQACAAPDYGAVAAKAIIEMHRQVGDLVVDAAGIARSGLLVRHLVLPDNLAGTEAIMRFLAEEVSTQTYVNVMSQYRPCGDISAVPGLNRPVTAAEYHRALNQARAAGIRRLDKGM